MLVRLRFDRQKIAAFLCQSEVLPRRVRFEEPVLDETGEVVGILSASNLMTLEARSPFALRRSIQSARTEKDLDDAVADMPDTPIEDEWLGVAMLYSSGTTGRPKGIVRPLPEVKPDDDLPLMHFLLNLWRYRDGMIYLSPAPLYHAAPLRFNMSVMRLGGTSIIMEHFDPEQYLQLAQKYKVTHTQLVPTMFIRML